MRRRQKSPTFVSVRTLAERVKWVVETSEYGTDRAFAAAAGVAPSYLGYLMKGLRGKRFGADVAKRIARTRGVSWRWLMTGEGSPEAADPVDEPSDGPRDVMDEVLIALGPNLDEAERRLARARAKAHSTPGALSWDECIALVQQVRRDVRRARAQVPASELEPATPEDELLALHAVSEHLRRRLDAGATLEQGLAELGAEALVDLVPPSLRRATLVHGARAAAGSPQAEEAPGRPGGPPAAVRGEPSSPRRGGAHGPKGAVRTPEASKRPSGGLRR